MFAIASRVRVASTLVAAGATHPLGSGNAFAAVACVALVAERDNDRQPASFHAFPPVAQAAAATRIDGGTASIRRIRSDQSPPGTP